MTKEQIKLYIESIIYCPAWIGNERELVNSICGEIDFIKKGSNDQG